MAYLSLYRKYRSQDFDTIVGQKHVVQTLRNAIESGRIGHAYIFSGPRGTGKTSMARILAKALNCEAGTTTKPCLICAQCEKIKAGTAVDVIEIDAASNRGIDEIRQLREQVHFVPVEGRYKIYIIDEVHMLTTEAFNALLKTLEEPPRNVLFILATTEMQKIPATIISRCQRMDFKRITTADIMEHLTHIAQAEGVVIDQKSTNYIARSSDGCMRDALSLLDQLISYKGNALNFDDVITVLGTADASIMLNLAEKLLAKNVQDVLTYVEALVLDGKNILQLNKDFIGSLRDLLLVKLGATEAIEAGSDVIDRMKQLLQSTTLSEIKQLILLFSRADTDMRWHANARLLFELAVMEYCFTQAEIQPQPVAAATVRPMVAPTNTPGGTTIEKPIAKPSLASLVKQVESTPKVVERPAVPMPTPSAAIIATKAQPVQTVKPSPLANVPKINSAPAPVAAAAAAVSAATNTASKPVPKDLSLVDIKHFWPDIIQKVKIVKPALYILLCEGVPQQFVDQTVVLAYKDNFSYHRDKIMRDQNREGVEAIFNQVFAQPLKLKTVLLSQVTTTAESTHLAKEAADLSATKAGSQTDQLLKIFPGKVMGA